MSGRRALALAAALFAGGCHPDLTVQVRMGDRPPNPTYLVGGPQALALAGDIAVSRFRVVIRRLRLESNPTDGATASPDQTVIEEGPFLLDLTGAPLQAGATTKIVSDFGVAPKSFYELDLALSPVTVAEAADLSLAPLLGLTFVIEGRDRGIPFTFESALESNVRSESVFRLGTNHNNIDVNVAPARWFDDRFGGTLHPTDPDPDGTRAQLIEQNVVDSISAYEDDDLDGNPDPLG